MNNTDHSRKFTNQWYESLNLDDTRYYGVFLKGTKESRFILIDPVRWLKVFNADNEVKENMKAVMAKRNGPLFQPKRKAVFDYNINVMLSKLDEIRREWDKTNKPIINRVLSEICGKFFTPYDDDLAQIGILNADEAVTNARMKTFFSHEFAELRKKELYYSLYAQYFHQMVSQIEALCIRVLTQNGFELDTFCRNDLYVFKGNKQELVRDLDGFKDFDKMYAIWNFLKHNSLSTFNVLKTGFPDVLLEGDYTQGELACFHVNFTDELISSIFDGADRFFKGYCRLVFGEDELEAMWNSEEHFLQNVYREIENGQNPLGLPFWL